MAWVARYMTDRFISRSRSQPPAASGAFSTREPSSDGMLFKIAERSSGLLLVSMSTRSVRSRRLAVALVKEQDGLAELDPVAGAEGGLVDGLAVDERPVGRAQVEDAIPPLFEPELGVAAGNLGIVEPNGVRVVPAQGHGTGCELEPLSLVGPLDHEQGGHEVFSPRLGCDVAA